MKTHLTKLFVFLLFLGVANIVNAQNKIEGQVVDSTGEGIIGANVVIQGTTLGGITDLNGNFMITGAPDKGTLVVSFIGYQKQSLAINGKTSFRIVLQEDSEVLSDVVVVGYGTQRKKDLTGSVIQVKPNDLKMVTTSNPLQGLQGRAPGVSVMTDNRPGRIANDAYPWFWFYQCQ